MKVIRYIALAMTLMAGMPVMAQQRQIYKVKPLTEAQRRSLERIPRWMPAAAGENNNLPQGVDNSVHKYFPEVFFQKGNSCSQASGVRYVYTYEVNRLLDRDARASDENVFSYHFTWNYLNEGTDEGALVSQGYDMMKTAGCATLVDMPDESGAVSSTTWMDGYDKYLRAMKYRVKSYQSFTLKTSEGILRLKQFLHNHGDMTAKTGGIVTFSCLSEGWNLRTYRGPSVTGIKSVITSNGTDGAHALTIVGYDDTVESDLNADGVISDAEKGAFIIVNSWGTSWADRGKSYYPYKLFLDPVSEGGIAESSAEALTVEPAFHEPEVVFKINLTYTSRNDLMFTLGVAEGNDAPSPTVRMTYPIMLNQGGDCYMRGDGTAESFKTIEVGMDFTDMLQQYGHFKNPKYFLSVRKIAKGKTGEGQVNDFSVIDYRSGNTYHSVQNNVEIRGEAILTTSEVTTEKVSANPNRWLQSGSDKTVKSPFILRTAQGEQVKMQFVDFDSKNGTVKVRYSHLH